MWILKFKVHRRVHSGCHGCHGTHISSRCFLWNNVNIVNIIKWYFVSWHVASYPNILKNWVCYWNVQYKSISSQNINRAAPAHLQSTPYQRKIMSALRQAEQLSTPSITTPSHSTVRLSVVHSVRQSGDCVNLAYSTPLPLKIIYYFLSVVNAALPR